MRRIALMALVALTACKPAEHPRSTLRASVLGVAHAVKLLDSSCAATARTLGGLSGAKLAEQCAGAYRTARASLLSAEAALDSWGAADQGNAVCAAVKASRALLEGVHAAQSAGASLPPSVVDGAQIATALLPLGERGCR